MRKHTRRSKTLGDLSSDCSSLSIASFSRRSASQSDLSTFCSPGKKNSEKLSANDNSDLDGNTARSSGSDSSRLCRKSFKGQGIYEGNLTDGMRSGFGRLITFDKKRVVYEGEWSNDIPHGFGTKRFQNGDQHHGHYRDGKRHGWGVYSHVNGDKYSGDWADGLMHGKGKFTWATGESYEGDLLNGTITGEGTKMQLDGSDVTGSFLNGKAHGQCVKMYACGDEYRGEYQHDKRHGVGRYSWAEGYTYEGSWRLDKMSGCGHKFGRAVVGGAARARTHSFGGSPDLLADDPVACYMGDYLSGHRWGHGAALNWDGSVYQGHWHKDLRHGRGLCWYQDGLLYEGEFVDGSRHGMGLLTQCKRPSVISSRDIYVGESALLDLLVQMETALLVPSDAVGDAAVPEEARMTPEDDLRVLRLFAFDVELFLLQADVSDGIHYVGEWKHGQIHGYGTLYRRETRIVSGTFSEGLFVTADS